MKVAECLPSRMGRTAKAALCDWGIGFGRPDDVPEVWKMNAVSSASFLSIISGIDLEVGAESLSTIGS